MSFHGHSRSATDPSRDWCHRAARKEAWALPEDFRGGCLSVELTPGQSVVTWTLVRRVCEAGRCLGGGRCSLTHGSVQVRTVRAGDGRGCARAWSDAGRYLQEIDPAVGRIPAQAGLVERFEGYCASPRPPEELWLVAERDAEVVGFVQAVVALPSEDAEWQLQRDMASCRLVIEALAVVAEERRAGVGAALMTAVEEIGRARGAMVATLDTNLRSYLSVPFYERMGYERQAVIFPQAPVAAPNSAAGNRR
jgi:GNAT superfamily N-acetyltransferase